MKTIVKSILCAGLLAGAVSPVFFTSCQQPEQPEINITLESDYSGIIDAINNANTSLLEKLEAIQNAMGGITTEEGENKNMLELIIEALESLSGSLDEKLGAIEQAITSQTTTLETKLGLVEGAVTTGFSNASTAMGLLKQALESIQGTVEGFDIAGIISSLGSIEQALNQEQMMDVLNNIFNAVDGLTDYSDILAAIQEAIEAIEIPEIPENKIDEEAAAKVMKQWKTYVHSPDHEGPFYFIRDFGYTFKNYCVGWFDYEPEYESWIMNGGNITSVSTMPNGWIKMVTSDTKDFFMVFRNVTETTAEYMLYYTYEDWGYDYGFDEYGWFGFSDWNHLTVCDPPYPLTWESYGLRVSGVDKVFDFYGASGYLNNYNPTKTFIDNFVEENGKIPHNMTVINGFGTKEDFEKAAGVAGTIVLLNRGGGLAFWEKLKNASEAGATAVFCANNIPGMLYLNVGGITSDVNPIPFFGVSKEFGEIFGLDPDGEYSCVTYDLSTMLYYIKITDPNNYGDH